VRALVTGARGQDGTLLRALLTARGVEVLGLDRPRPGAKDRAIRDVDVGDPAELARAFEEFAPDQVYHLAACHHSSEWSGSIALEREMIATNFRAAEVLLTMAAERKPACRVLLAGSSQMYTGVPGVATVVSEETPMHPATFYGRTKAWARELLDFYRERHGLFGSTAILFNHESTLRSPEFVTRKITIGAARAARGLRPDLHLRDVGSETDWSSAADVVEGMHLALSADAPADYVLASGVAHSVADVLEIAFRSVGLDWREFATFDPPREGPRATLLGDTARIRSLGWAPSVSFAGLIEDMVRHDLDLLAAGTAS
jgi:GDPmannose 4,6-dehydratase